MYSERRYWTRVSITASPPVELRLQQGDGVFQRLVPLLLLFPLALPLLGCQLHVQADLVLDRLRPDGTRKTIVSLANHLQSNSNVVRRGLFLKCEKQWERCVGQAEAEKVHSVHPIDILFSQIQDEGG